MAEVPQLCLQRGPRLGLARGLLGGRFQSRLLPTCSSLKLHTMPKSHSHFTDVNVEAE